MTAPQEGPRPPRPPEDWVEDELDLGRIVRVLYAWRWDIVVGTVLVTVVAVLGYWLLSALQKPVYTATAQVAILRTKTEVTFEDRFRTLSEQGQLARPQESAASRRGALLGLVQHGAVAEAVVRRMGEALAPEERTPARLLRAIEARLVDAPSGRASGGSDLISIVAKADEPGKAAQLANAWAEEYVTRVNQLYGTIPAEMMASVRSELDRAQVRFDASQQALEGFIATNRIPHLGRLIAEKQEVIQSLQDGRKSAVAGLVEAELAARLQVINAYIDALAQNRLLAFSKEQEGKREMVAALIDAQLDSRLQALRADRDARSELFTQYVESQIQNQLLALQEEQRSKQVLFLEYSEADLNAKLAVFNQQVEDRIGNLTRDYEAKRRLQRLLENTRGLLAQVRSSGEAGAASSGLAILLLKAEAHATTEGFPANLQLQLGSVPDLNLGAEAQVRDLSALEAALQDRIRQLEASIVQHSAGLLQNQGYRHMDSARPGDDELLEAVRNKYLELFRVDELARTADQVTVSSALAESIQKKYDEMFQLGPLALASAREQLDSQSFAAIQERYPELFGVGALSNLTEAVGRDTPLDRLAEDRAKDLLQLRGLEDLPRYSASAEPLLRAIGQLEKEIQGLEAEKEAESARRKNLEQERDLTWSTLMTLRNKSAELDLSSTAFNAELRLGSPAVEPDRPEAGRPLLVASIAFTLGLMLSLLGVFIAESLGRKPILTS